MHELIAYGLGVLTGMLLLSWLQSHKKPSRRSSPARVSGKPVARKPVKPRVMPAEKVPELKPERTVEHKSLAEDRAKWLREANGILYAEETAPAEPENGYNITSYDKAEYGKHREGEL